MSSIPLDLPRFELIKSLGEGAVGNVYLVKDHDQNGRKVALKTLENEINFDENTYKRFKQEINILQQIDHPNLIKAYDLLETDDYLAYTMEYVDGADLGSIYKSKDLAKGEIDSLMIQLLSALSALHNQGIWHRDIKLENIMITNCGQLKLADLGLVKNEFNKNLTRTGVLLGTAQYMPPEYVKDAIYDARGDIYAAGVVMFELIVQRRRFPNLPGNKIIEMLFACDFKIDDAELKQVKSRKFQKIIAKATEPRLKYRYQSAEEMISDIDSGYVVDANDNPSDVETENDSLKTSIKFEEIAIKKNNMILYLICSVLVVFGIVALILFG